MNSEITMNILQVLTLGQFKQIQERQKKRQEDKFISLPYWYEKYAPYIRPYYRPYTIEDQLYDAWLKKEGMKRIKKEFPELYESIYDQWLSPNFEDSKEHLYNEAAYETDMIWVIHKFPYDYVTQPPLDYYKGHGEYDLKYQSEL